LPLQFKEGQTAASLNLDGTEIYSLSGLSGGEIKPRQDVILTVERADGTKQEVALTLRIDTPIEIEYYKNGGILPFVLKQLLNRAAGSAR
jgi:aconitate hydratase